jgi:hypothetical protein
MTIRVLHKPLVIPPVCTSLIRIRLTAARSTSYRGMVGYSGRVTAAYEKLSIAYEKLSRC